MIDLHTHSYYSDGTDSPTELVRAAAACGLTAVALTDHDTVEGLSEARAAGERYGIRVTPGIELSASHKAEVHILGYGIDASSPVLTEALSEILAVRVRRQEEMIRRLGEIGVGITVEEAWAVAGRSRILCRAHTAKLLVARGYAADVPEAFRRYLTPGCYAYVKEHALTPETAIRLIRDAGGVAVAAHLHLMGLTDAELEAALDAWTEAGLGGVEGYYTEYTPEMGERYRAMARERGLILTGGSDYHGGNKPQIRLGRGWGDLAVPEEVLEGLALKR